MKQNDCNLGVVSNEEIEWGEENAFVDSEATATHTHALPLTNNKNGILRNKVRTTVV